MPLIPVPKKIQFNKETDYKGQFVIEPLYPGYGTTVGNTLRRVLLSSIPGAAITSIKITGADHEFAPLDYVKEDIVDILLNIKQVNLSVAGEIDAETPLIIKINKTGEGKAKAGDFECPSQVKIANPDLVIATLTDKAAKFEAECIVEKGMGYLPTENMSDKKLDIGNLSVDAIFTPINHINVESEHVRVGEMTNWDKLVISLETNGTITCQQAFDLAVQILTEQFASLSSTEKAQTEKTPEDEKDITEEAEKNKIQEELDKPTKEEDGEKKEEEKKKKEKVKEVIFFFKQKTAYEIYQCDWSSDVCSSDLIV